MSDKARIIDLQGSLTIAKRALEKIQYGCHDPEGVAETALDALHQLAPKKQLQGLVGHGSSGNGRSS